MIYLIIILLIFLAVIRCIFGLLKNIIGALLFSPVLNSVLSIPYFVFIMIFLCHPITIILSVIAIADCIRDITLSKVIYNYSFDRELSTYDKKYVRKSILGIFTFGYVRVIYTMVVNPIIYGNIKSEIKKKMLNGDPLPYNEKNYSGDLVKNYYYSKFIQKLTRQGNLISNKETVDAEINIIRERLEKMYPKKLIEKAIDKFAGDEEVKRMREKAEKRLLSYGVKYYAYIPDSLYKVLPDKVSKAMSDKAPMSLYDIMQLDDVRETIHPLVINANCRDYDQNNREWGCFFVIQALKPLVEDGTYEDKDITDKPLEVHIYEYKHSTKKIKSINANENPALCLD